MFSLMDPVRIIIWRDAVRQHARDISPFVIILVAMLDFLDRCNIFMIAVRTRSESTVKHSMTISSNILAGHSEQEKEPKMF